MTTTHTPDGASALATVHLVEDDESARIATARFLRASGYNVQAYPAAADFLATLPHEGPGCVVLDLRLPDATGLDVQRALAEGDAPLPVIFLTGQGEVHDSVQAMKSGAVDFLLKTDDGAALIDAVRRALARNASERTIRARCHAARRRYGTLSARERDVFAHLITGQLNKQIGYALGIAEGTIKIHRQRVLQKMQADSLTDLARMADDLGIAPAAKLA